ncbi:hypothetical protein AeMF1_012177 [Aphanomyces euteiches]|nr:hypothetical protein AeMF1_012177 [Aphanomyces euteiches]KAH9192640.1 hypothetical protein AeNC1_005383 [Aphanomyces euteiches]
MVDPSSPRCTGELVFEQVSSLGKTTATHEYVAYPLKFLHPSTMVPLSFPTAVTCILGYGGGLVGGDCTRMNVQVGPDATAVLCTQATTKVYKPKLTAPTHTSQEMSVTLDSNAFLALVPDPITCFDGAMYKQYQRFTVHPTASLVFIDWMTSGRHARGESWSFASYESCNQVVMEGDDAPILLDRMRLQEEAEHSLRARMGGMTVLGTVVLVGPRVKAMADALIQRGARKALKPNESPIPYGHVATNVHPNVRSAVSPLGKSGAIVRIAGRTTEEAYAFVKDLLAPLEDLVGFKCFQENR